MAKICMAGAGSVIETAKLIKTEMLERGKSTSRFESGSISCAGRRRRCVIRI